MNMIDPMRPAPYRIERVRRELSDTFTIDLVPAERKREFAFQPGQFNMLYAFGVGEIPDQHQRRSRQRRRPSSTPPVRVGNVTNGHVEHWAWARSSGCAVRSAPSWPVEELEGSDIVIVTGGIGLAPLRPGHLPASSPTGQAYGNICIPVRSADARRTSCSARNWNAGAASSTCRSMSPSTTRRADGAGKVGVVTQAHRPRRFRSAPFGGRAGLRPRDHDALSRSMRWIDRGIAAEARLCVARTQT